MEIQKHFEEYNQREGAPYFGVLPAQTLEKIRDELFEGGEIEQADIEPHGIDTGVEAFFDFTEAQQAWPEIETYSEGELTGLASGGEFQRRGGVVFERREIGGEQRQIAHLEPGHEYFALLGPSLRFHPRELEAKDLEIRVYPRSTLLRVGVAAYEEVWGSAPFRPVYKAALPDYSERRAAMTIQVLNPHGVDIEKGTPIFQVAVRRGVQEIKRQEGEFISKELIREGQELTLGSVLEFAESGLLTRGKKDQKATVTQPVESDVEGNFSLEQGVYLFRSAERVSLGNDERGRLGTIPQISAARLLATEALVDAGFQGALHELVEMNERIVVRKGQKIGTLFIDKVPPTEKLYAGEWQEK